MTAALETFTQKVAELCERFEKYKATYRTHGCKPSKQKPFSIVPGWRLYSWEYVSAAPKIWNLLTRKAVEGGSLETFIQSLPKVTARSNKQLWLIPPDRNRAVDVDFIQYLEAQRARLRSVVRFGDVEEFEITRGEINQTIYRRFISSNASHSRLLKGVEVGPFRVRSKLSQGEVEWLNKRTFQAEFKVAESFGLARIATQRITGVDEKQRIVACVAEANTFFADSTNSIIVSGNSPYEINYVVALLNSTLYQWRFKLTSTNNNVGTNELEAMPFRLIDFSDKAEALLHRKIAELARRASEQGRRADTLVSAARRDEARETLTNIMAQIDRMAYAIFNLTPEEVRLIEGSTSFCLGERNQTHVIAQKRGLMRLARSPARGL